MKVPIDTVELIHPSSFSLKTVKTGELLLWSASMSAVESGVNNQKK